MKMTGKFITFEGPEGSGKSTHIKLLKAYLEERGIEVVLTREPGGTPLGEEIRKILQHDHTEPPVPSAEVLLFLASRAQHVERLIRPSLEQGKWVLCDRFADSTFAYQGYGRGFDMKSLRAVNAFAVSGLRPDLTVLLDVTPETSRARLAVRQASTATTPDRIEREAAAFHERVRNGFLALAKEEPDRIALISTERDREAVAAAVRAVVERLLSLNP